MRLRALVLTLALAGCVVRPEPVPVEPKAEPVIEGCPLAPRGPGKLPPLVTTEKLRAWADETELARQATVEALRICSVRLRKALAH